MLEDAFVKFDGPILHTRFGAPYVMGAKTVFNGPGHCLVLTRINEGIVENGE